MKQKSIIISASTFPRWINDAVPMFVFDHALEMKKYYKSVVVLAPHYKGAKTNEVMSGIIVKRFRYFYPSHKEDIAYAEFKNKTGITSKLKSIPYSLSQIASTIKIVLKYKPEVINAHWIIPQGFTSLLVSKIFRKKLVVNVHGADVFTLNSRLFMVIKKFVLKHADTVVVNSSYTEEVCRKMCDRNYFVIPPQINSRRFKDVKPLKDQQTFEILFVGRLAKEKGVEYLIKALSIIKNKQNNQKINLTIIGDGVDKDRLLELCKELGLVDYVDFKGWVTPDKITNFFAKASVFVGPSITSDQGWVEAFGIVFAEAQLAGLPVITTNTGGQKDIVEDGVTGFLVSEKDAATIASKLLELINDKARLTAMSQKSRQLAVEKYDSSKLSKKFVESIS